MRPMGTSRSFTASRPTRRGRSVFTSPHVLRRPSTACPAGTQLPLRSSRHRRAPLRKPIGRGLTRLRAGNTRRGLSRASWSSATPDGREPVRSQRYRPPFLSCSQRSKSTATIRSSCTPAASPDASQTMGGPITVGSRNLFRSGTASRGSIPVTVAPPGRSRLVQLDADRARQVGGGRPRALAGPPGQRNRRSRGGRGGGHRQSQPARPAGHQHIHRDPLVTQAAGPSPLAVVFGSFTLVMTTTLGSRSSPPPSCTKTLMLMDHRSTPTGAASPPVTPTNDGRPTARRAPPEQILYVRAVPGGSRSGHVYCTRSRAKLKERLCPEQWW
jgi:hypothetical protein